MIKKGTGSQEHQTAWHHEGLLGKVLLEPRPEGPWEGVKAGGGEGRSGESVLGWNKRVARAQGQEARVPRLGVGFILCGSVGNWACVLASSLRNTEPHSPTYFA